MGIAIEHVFEDLDHAVRGHQSLLHPAQLRVITTQLAMQLLDMFARFRIRILLEQTGQFRVLYLQLREFGAMLFHAAGHNLVFCQRAVDHQNKTQPCNDHQPGQKYHHAFTRLERVEPGGKLIPALLHRVPALVWDAASGLVVNLNST